MMRKSKGLVHVPLLLLSLLFFFLSKDALIDVASASSNCERWHHAMAAFVPNIFDGGGKAMPTVYDGWFNQQIAKQSAASVQKAISSGKTRIEVNFPPVPNVDEVKFGTPLNQRFGTNVVAPNIQVKGGYKPGSDLSRNLIAYSNVYWAKQLAVSVGGGLLAGLGSRPVTAVTAEPVNAKLVQSKGSIKSIELLGRRTDNRDGGCPALIAINPGGEETWERIRSIYGVKGPMVILNNAYSTTYDLGNKRGYEEAYYLKRISKGWVFRMFPGPWQAYLEKPDGSVELLQSYQSKPALSEVATLVREESFRRFAIRNDRYSPGFGARL